MELQGWVKGEGGKRKAEAEVNEENNDDTNQN